MRILLTAAERAALMAAENVAVAGDPSPLATGALKEVWPSLEEPEPDDYGRLWYYPFDILRALLAHAEVEATMFASVDEAKAALKKEGSVYVEKWGSGYTATLRVEYAFSEDGKTEDEATLALARTLAASKVP